MAGSDKAAINFLRGWPSPSLLPIAQVKTAAQIVLDNPKIAVQALQYGPDAGYGLLREEIAKWLSGFYRSVNEPQRLCITGGASQNLACILQVFTDPLYTQRIWMVAPSYYLACRIFLDSGFNNRLRAVPEDKEGMDVAYLEEKIRQMCENSPPNDEMTLKPKRPWSIFYRHVFYAVPTFSNPSGKTMSLRRRRQLVTLARKYDALIITDDVYDFLQWSTETQESLPYQNKALLPRLVDIDREMGLNPGAEGFGNTVSNGSFSKIIGPGCRTGWAEGTEKFAYGLSQVGSSRSGGSPSQITSTYITHLLKSNELQIHIANVLQPAYALRHRIMMQAIEKYLLPLGVSLSRADFEGTFGGYFIWLSLPESLLAEQVGLKAKETENLIIGHGKLFEVYGDETIVNLDTKIRLCFSWEGTEALVEGIQRLGSVVRQMLDAEMAK